MASSAIPEKSVLLQILRELEAGASRALIPQRINLSTRRFQAALLSPELLALAHETSSSVAVRLQEDADARMANPDPIRDAIPEAIGTLLEIMRSSESDAQRRGAARDILELDEMRRRTAAIAGKEGNGDTEQLQVAPSQLSVMAQAAAELRQAGLVPERPTE